MEMVAHWLVKLEAVVVMGPMTATFQWILSAGWKPALPDTRTMATEDDVCRARIGACRTDDALILQDYRKP